MFVWKTARNNMRANDNIMNFNLCNFSVKDSYNKVSPAD